MYNQSFFEFFESHRTATSAPFNLMAIRYGISEMDALISKGEESGLRKLWVNASGYSQRVSQHFNFVNDIIYPSQCTL